MKESMKEWENSLGEKFEFGISTMIMHYALIRYMVNRDRTHILNEPSVAFSSITIVTENVIIDELQPHNSSTYTDDYIYYNFYTESCKNQASAIVLVARYLTYLDKRYKKK